MAERFFSVDDFIVLFSSNFSNSSSVIAIQFFFVCIVLILVAVRFASWTMMAELCFSVDDFVFFFS